MLVQETCRVGSTRGGPKKDQRQSRPLWGMPTVTKDDMPSCFFFPLGLEVRSSRTLLAWERMYHNGAGGIQGCQHVTLSARGLHLLGL